MGPAVAELEFEERANEPFLFFAADKTDPGAYNLPLWRRRWRRGSSSSSWM
jgi:fructose 1,6-bisphosphate aldolase/phosphatase